MARGHGRILASIWEDGDFLDLDEREQRLYMFLVSQPNLNHAGLLDLTLRRWARKARGLTVSELEKRIAALEEAGFIVVDHDTEELLIRSFVRNDGVWRMPKVMGAMVSGALEISSRELQRAMLTEMDRIPVGELSVEPTKLRNGNDGPSIREQVEGHIDTLRRAFGNPRPDPSGGGCGTPSEPPSGSSSEPPSPSPSDTRAEGGPTPSMRGRAGASHARTPAPAPTPTPEEEPTGTSGEQPEVIVVEESDFVGAADAAREESAPVTADVILGEWIERCNKRPPGNVIGRVGKQIKALLAESIDPDDIRRGLAQWMAKGADPSAVSSFVNQAMNSARPQPGTDLTQFAAGHALAGTDSTVAGWAAVADSFDLEDSA